MSSNCAASRPALRMPSICSAVLMRGCRPAGRLRVAVAAGTWACCCGAGALPSWHFLNFRPLPHQHGSLRPGIFCAVFNKACSFISAVCRLFLLLAGPGIGARLVQGYQEIISTAPRRSNRNRMAPARRAVRSRSSLHRGRGDKHERPPLPETPHPWNRSRPASCASPGCSTCP